MNQIMFSLQNAIPSRRTLSSRNRDGASNSKVLLQESQKGYKLKEMKGKPTAIAARLKDKE